MMFGYGFYFDPTYILVLAAVILSVIASARVNSTYRKYASVNSALGVTGAQAARRILESQGIHDVAVERVAGNLTDHYDPRSKILRLSDTVFGSNSIAAIGVAAHECGHAVQDQLHYGPLKLRGTLVPVASLGAKLAWPLILIGILITGSNSILVQLGILLFSAAVLFQLVTLPVEFNASKRALDLLSQNGILYDNEIKETKKVLDAAALTYVAAAAGSILQLLRLFILFGGRNNRD